MIAVRMYRLLNLKTSAHPQVSDYDANGNMTAIAQTTVEEMMTSASRRGIISTDVEALEGCEPLMEIGHHQAPDRTPQRSTTEVLTAIISKESQEHSKIVSKQLIMPGGGGSSTGNPTRSPARAQPDIRNFLSPPRPPRNRRIIESDSSEPDNQNGGAAIPAGIQPQQPRRAEGHENEHPQPELNPLADTQGNSPPPLIEISDSDSSDSMYIPRMRSRAEAPRDQQHGDQHQRHLTPQRQRQSIPQVQRPPTPRQQNQATPLSQRQRQPSSRRQSQRTPQRQRQLSAEDQRNRLTGEAESTSEDESEQLSADESNEDAAALYRSAIMGVRNRPNAQQQVTRA